MNISDEAAEALACVLAYEALVEADMGGYGWDAQHDSSESFLPAARTRAKAYLEAAAPYILRDHLLALAADARARGDIGKDGGVEAWDYLTFHAQKASPYRTQDQP